MRWTIEVSASQPTLSAGAEPLVVEAKSWQAALQVARAGDPTAGPISQLSIELTADGYQATDPATKVRYLIKKAAPDTPLRLPTPPGEAAPPAGAAPPTTPPASADAAPSGGAAPSTLPTGVSPADAASPAATTVAPAGSAPTEATSAPSQATSGQPQATSAPSQVTSGHPEAASATSKPESASPGVESASPGVESAAAGVTSGAPGAESATDAASSGASTPLSGASTPLSGASTPLSGASTPLADAPTPSSASPTPVAAPSEPAAVAPVAARPATLPPASAPAAPPPAAPDLAVAPASVPPVSVPPVSVSVVTPQAVVVNDPNALPTYEVVLSREEQPSEKSPLTYREVVYAVPTGTPEVNAERLVRKLWSEIAQQLWAAPPGKFINLAIFDVVFTGRPPRPPLVTLTWKDWRGPEPELAYPMRQRTSMRPAGPASMPPPAVKVEASRVPTIDPISARPMISLEAPPVASAPPASILPETQSVPPSALPDGGAAHLASEPVSAVRSVEPHEPAPATSEPRASVPPETAPSRTEPVEPVAPVTSRTGDEIPTSLPHVEVSRVSIDIDVDVATPEPSAVADEPREAPPMSASSMVLPEPPPEKEWKGDAAPASSSSVPPAATERGANLATAPIDEPSAVVPVVVLAEVATAAAPRTAAEIEGSAPLAPPASAAPVPSTEPAASDVPSTEPAESSPTRRGEELHGGGAPVAEGAPAEAPRVVSAAEAALTGATVSTPPAAVAAAAAATEETATATASATAAEAAPASTPAPASKGAAVADPFADPFAAPRRDDGPRVDARGKTVKGGARRLSGDDLLGDLFEAMHDVHFQANTLEAAHFVLWLAVEKMPCKGAVCHLFDINRREFVVVHALGDRRAALLLKRASEREPLINQVMRTRRARVIPGGDELLSGERWTTGGPMAHSVVVAPVALGGRFLGLLELLDPVDGGEFAESDGYALAYIGEQFAEFLGQRGVMIEPEAIATFQPPKLG